MFRYIALAWDRRAAAASAAATGLARTLDGAMEWQRVLKLPGLHVFAAGQAAGANGAYPLSAERGIVLGKLFCRHDPLRQPAHGMTLPTRPCNDPQAQGRDLVNGFWGRYVAFLRTPDDGTCILRDPSGTLPCYLLRQQGVSIAFSWLDDILETLPAVALPHVDWHSLAAHALGTDGPGSRRTALDGVAEMLPGELFDLRRGDGDARLLWSAVDVALSHEDHDVEVAADLLRHTVRGCTQAWAGCYGNVLLRLSGGLDSAIVLSCLAQGRDAARVTCLNYHSAGAASDEREYARLAAARSGCELIERERDAGFRLDRVLQAARTPTPTSYVGSLGAAMDSSVAAGCGATALFTGGGGDQLFFEIRQWWPAADYLRLRGPDGGFCAAAMDAARLGGVSFWKAARLAFAERVRPGGLESDQGTGCALACDEALLGVARRQCPAHPALANAAALPIGKLAQARYLMQPSGYYQTFEPASAPELVNPLLSQPVMELCLKLPTYRLAHGGRGRGLARKAFAADIPAQIATRRSKGGMQEHVKTVLARNVGFARSLLLDGELVKRGILHRARVEEALSGRPTRLAVHVSEIHMLVAIEAWLHRWAVARAAR